MSRFGHNVVSVFDVPPEARDFLADVIESSQAPNEVEELLQQSLLAGAQDWYSLIECAKYMQQTHKYDKSSLDGQDLLTHVSCMLDGRDPPPDTGPQPWEATDRLIAIAKSLEDRPFVPVPVTVPQVSGGLHDQRQAALLEAKSRFTTSYYWSDQPQEKSPRESNKWSALAKPAPDPSQTLAPKVPEYDASQSVSADKLSSEQGSPQEVVHDDKTLCTGSSSTKSPYFTVSPVVTVASRRILPGKKPSVPFAPLTSPEFGLVQEKFAHEPFWLLIVVTFLIKTKGKHAIPVFYKVKKRFPILADIACAANSEHIIDMIRHLGLADHRLTLMQKYARIFLSDPPTPGVRYKVKNYDQREVESSPSSRLPPGEYQPSFAKVADEQDLEAWEIGHLTQGKYALDSWRIFCRDEFLGRATDWNGGDREPEFQPEWMRVRPDDKELRAYLRWMWMKEGWEWDPSTGERTVLRKTMRDAVNEGGVEYDDKGGLRLMDTSKEYPLTPLLDLKKPTT
ncbi:hypothetical protein ACHAPA_006299 [Fusarium lateritium]